MKKETLIFVTVAGIAGVIAWFGISTFLSHKPAAPPAPPSAATLDTRKISVNFVKTPFSEVLDFIRDVTGLNIVLSKKAEEELGKKEITLRVKKIQLRSCPFLEITP